MAASLRCSEILPDSKEDSSLCCAFSFNQNTRKSSNTSLLCEHKIGASYIPLPSYALSVQNCSSFCRYREHTYSWMLGVCRDKKSDLSVAYIGMNYFDRYLSVKVVDKSKVELLNWLCLHIASSRFDKYSEHLSFREITQVFEDTYSIQEARVFEMEILSVLDFRLCPYSPYSEGGGILEMAGHSSIYPNYQSLLNGVCMKYDSLTVNPKSITHTCLLLAWVFSYPSNDLPTELNMCVDIYKSDFDKIIKWVRELFPMMCDACDKATHCYNTRQNSKRVSPTSVLQNL